MKIPYEVEHDTIKTAFLIAIIIIVAVIVALIVIN